MLFFHVPESLRQRAKRYPRRIGALLSVMGICLFFAFVVMPMSEASRHVHEIWISRDATIMSGVGLAIGGLQLLLGSRLAKIITPREGGSWIAVVVILLIAFGGGLPAHAALRQSLEREGYRSTGPLGHFEVYQYPAA